jgi:hypothetical protein
VGWGWGGGAQSNRCNRRSIEPQPTNRTTQTNRLQPCREKEAEEEAANNVGENEGSDGGPARPPQHAQHDGHAAQRAQHGQQQQQDVRPDDPIYQAMLAAAQEAGGPAASVGAASSGGGGGGRAGSAAAAAARPGFGAGARAAAGGAARGAGGRQKVVNALFGEEEEEEGTKRRKLKPIQYTDEEMQAVQVSLEVYGLGCLHGCLFALWFGVVCSAAGLGTTDASQIRLSRPQQQDPAHSEQQQQQQQQQQQPAAAPLNPEAAQKEALKRIMESIPVTKDGVTSYPVKWQHYTPAVQVTALSDTNRSVYDNAPRSATKPVPIPPLNPAPNPNLKYHPPPQPPTPPNRPRSGRGSARRSPRLWGPRSRTLRTS